MVAPETTTEKTMRRAYARSPIPTIFVPKQSEAFSIADRYFRMGRFALPFKLRYFWLLPFVYLVSGIFLPSLWRGVDANTYSVLQGMGGDTYFQGEVFRQSVSTAPAYYRLLDFGTRLLSGLFSPASAMRLTHVALLMGGLMALYRALRHVFAAEVATITVLVTATCLGGLEFMHVVGDKAGAFLAISITLWGIVQSFSRSYGGVVMGMGFVLSIMMGSGTLIPTLIPALLIMATKRGRQHPVFGIAMLLALSMMGVTLISLFMFTGRAATELGLWLPQYGIDDWGDFVDALTRQIWFTFPLWPTLFAFRHYTRKHWHASARSILMLGLLGFSLALPLSLAGADGSMMLLPFLALLFAPSLLLIGNHWLRAWHWFNFLFFTMALLPIVIIRVMWSVGVSNSVQSYLAHKTPGFDASIPWWALLASALIVLAWGYWTIAAKWHVSWTFRPALGWVFGVMSLWGVAVLLWLPAIDYTKSYQNMVQQIQHHRMFTQKEGKVAAPCVDVHLAPFAFQVNWRYFTQQSAAANDTCDFRLITVGKAERQSLLLSDEMLRKAEQGAEEPIDEYAINNDVAPPLEWQSLEVYQRPGDTNESIVLQQRALKPRKRKK